MTTETDAVKNSSDDTEPIAEGTEEASVKKPGLFASKKVKVIGLVAIVMLVEALGMYFLLPSPSVASEDVQASTMPQDDVNVSGDEGDIREVEIGAFNTTNSIAAPGSVIHVSFTLVAIVSAENEQAFKEMVKDKFSWRVKQAVSKVVRSSSLEDLNAASHSTINRLIREEVNKVLGKSYVIRIVLGNPRTMEQ